ncbi:MAG TPA: MFS transporter [Ktedonobacteraceae bacterium]|nr:MFS transporter [Ktedonobacteraceae bacterium]
MATIEQSEGGIPSSRRLSINLPKLRWTQILAISIFWLALNFHWAALGIIILPSQVFKIVGDAQKGSALAFVLVPGAFVSLFANPLFGLLSDRTRGRLAVWGRRRPYILLGTLVNVGGLVWMASSRDILSLALGYIIVQFSNNAASAPFHALLPDIVPEEQRGLTSGVMGLLSLSGSIGGVIIGGLFIDASRPLPAYEQGLWLAYGIIIAVVVALMLITIFSINERRTASSQMLVQEAEQEAMATATPNTNVEEETAVRRSWLSPSVLRNVVGTVIVAGIVWGAMALWNRFAGASMQISGDVEQVVLELIVTVGILRLFDFNPRRDPDFAWVLVTRLVMMLGIYTVQDFLQFYMRDAVKVSNPEQQTTNFIIILSLTSLFSALGAGWLSDRLGRKRTVYVAGCFMALVGLIFIITQSLPIVLAAGAIFGIGYGAYVSVDWALVADVLPSHSNYARDMGVWNISLSLPQVIAPVIGGPLIDSFTRSGHPILGFQLLFAMAIVYCLIGTVTVRFIRGVKR